MTALCVLAETVALLGLLAAAVTFPLRLLRPDRDYTRWGQRGMLLGAGLLGMGLMAHFVRRGEGPLGDWANISFLLVLLLALAVLCVERFAKRPALAAFITPLMFGTALLGLLRAAKALPAISNHWLVVHILLSLVAYVCFTLAFAMAASYLISDHLLKRKQLERLPLLPPLASADRVGHGAVMVGLALFTIGLLVGALTFWDFGVGMDPKIPAAMVTWLIYAGYLGLRHLAGWRGRRLQWVLVAGFAMVVITFAFFGHNAVRLKAPDAAPVTTERA
ncbi:MAG: cytochrome c biogenesis protein CcsA [Armatimonadetes bacterium]|nr:cytochrome c biogenesis protein CcsA [Armatimonadota bacterium]